MYFPIERDRSRSRKREICDRVRAHAARNRRPIEAVLEIKLADYVETTMRAVTDRNFDVSRPLVAFSRFQAGC